MYFNETLTKAPHEVMELIDFVDGIDLRRNCVYEKLIIIETGIIFISKLILNFKWGK